VKTKEIPGFQAFVREPLCLPFITVWSPTDSTTDCKLGQLWGREKQVQQAQTLLPRTLVFKALTLSTRLNPERTSPHPPRGFAPRICRLGGPPWRWPSEPRAYRRQRHLLCSKHTSVLGNKTR